MWSRFIKVLNSWLDAIDRIGDLDIGVTENNADWYL